MFSSCQLGAIWAYRQEPFHILSGNYLHQWSGNLRKPASKTQPILWEVIVQRQALLINNLMNNHVKNTELCQSFYRRINHSVIKFLLINIICCIVLNGFFRTHIECRDIRLLAREIQGEIVSEWKYIPSILYITCKKQRIFQLTRSITTWPSRRFPV